MAYHQCFLSISPSLILLPCVLTSLYASFPKHRPMGMLINILIHQLIAFKLIRGIDHNHRSRSKTLKPLSCEEDYHSLLHAEIIIMTYAP